MQNLLQQFSGENVIVGGDLICPFAKDDKEGGRDPSSKKYVVAEVKLLLSSLDLEDVWRKLHPNDKQFTWRTPYQNIGSQSVLVWALIYFYSIQLEC